MTLKEAMKYTQDGMNILLKIGLGGMVKNLKRFQGLNWIMNNER